MRDLSDLEDVRAPHGRCDTCRSPFGMPNKDGMVFYQFDRSNICTACNLFDSRESSRRYDYNQNWATNHGRRSGGPIGGY